MHKFPPENRILLRISNALRWKQGLLLFTSWPLDRKRSKMIVMKLHIWSTTNSNCDCRERKSNDEGKRLQLPSCSLQLCLCPYGTELPFKNKFLVPDDVTESATYNVTLSVTSHRRLSPLPPFFVLSFFCTYPFFSVEAHVTEIQGDWRCRCVLIRHKEKDRFEWTLTEESRG